MKKLLLVPIVLVLACCNKTATEAKVPLETQCATADDCASTDMIKSVDGYCCNRCELAAGTKKSIADMHSWCAAHVAPDKTCPQLDCPKQATTIACESGQCVVKNAE